MRNSTEMNQLCIQKIEARKPYDFMRRNSSRTLSENLKFKARYRLHATIENDYQRRFQRPFYDLVFYFNIFTYMSQFSRNSK